MLCSSPYFPYQPGSATGSWKGSCIMPFDVAYRQWSTEPCVPSQFETTGRRPLYIHLKEYVCYDRMSIIPQDTEENGMLNAWLPPDLVYFEHGNGIEVSDPKGTLTTFYESCREGYPSKRQAPAADVIIIGKTDERQSAAWGSFRVRGRVRLSDGLVVLLWTSVSRP
ncbi:hypothetical protein BD779DRAFT_418852 [Infundibulicybe gibba]|nr:hypothetical protein BD779DRAFT_418852 [Infundibulicybe gibba]